MMGQSYEKHTSCLLCESKNIKALKGYEKHYLVKCSNCDFVFTERIPTLEELIKHYEGYGRNDYLSPITIKRYHELLDSFEPYRKTNKLIDVGCGIGHFLSIAKERGWEVYGTEFTDEAIEICEKKGIKMQQGVLNPENYNSEEFDIICSFEVIEHIYNPLQEVANFNKILRVGGAAYITTPNFNSISRRYLKADWSVIEYPEHLSYYTAKTLNKVFNDHGFKKKWIQTTGVSVTRLKGTLDRRKDKNKEELRDTPMELVGAQTPDEALRQKFENNRILGFAKSSLNSILTTAKIGDSMKALFEKQ